MKHQNHRKSGKAMDEREKLRKFRELDDAFAEALRELDDPAVRARIPVGSPVAALPEQQSAREEEAARQRRFEERLRALMQEYHQPAEQVTDLLQTLQKLGRIA